MLVKRREHCHKSKQRNGNVVILVDHVYPSKKTMLARRCIFEKYVEFGSCLQTWGYVPSGERVATQHDQKAGETFFNLHQIDIYIYMCVIKKHAYAFFPPRMDSHKNTEFNSSINPDLLRESPKSIVCHVRVCVLIFSFGQCVFVTPPIPRYLEKYRIIWVSHLFIRQGVPK